MLIYFFIVVLSPGMGTAFRCGTAGSPEKVSPALGESPVQVKMEMTFCFSLYSLGLQLYFALNIFEK